MKFKPYLDLCHDRKVCPVCGSRDQSLWDKEKTNLVSYVQCESCSLVFTNKIIANNLHADYFDGFNEARDDGNRIKRANRLAMYNLDYQYVQHFVSQKGNFLDFGCGSGRFLSMFGGNTQKYGVEFDRSAIEIGKTNHPDISFFRNLTEVPKTNNFQCIIFRGSFQYIPNIRPVLESCYSIMNDNAFLVVLSVPNTNSPLAILQRENWIMAVKNEHVNLYCLDALRRLFDGMFDIQHFDFPYLGTPYENHHEDMQKFIDLCQDNDNDNDKKQHFPFWGSLINLVARKR